MNPNPYFPPKAHDHGSVPVPLPADSAFAPALESDGFPQDLHYWLFGQEIAETGTTPARHRGGFSHLPRPVAEEWATRKAEEGWTSPLWLSPERECWGGGFALVTSAGGTMVLVVGDGGDTPAPHLVVCGGLPPRVLDYLLSQATAP